MEAIKRSWKDQKLYICSIIKQVSDYFDGDEVEWLRDYAKLIIEQHQNDFSKAIICFEDLLAQTKYMPRRPSST
jgi:hypothetical protein